MLIKEIKGRGRWAACRDSPTSSIPAVWVSAWRGSVDFGVALHAAVIQCFCGALARNERGEGLNLGLQGEVLVMLRSCLGGVFRAFAQSSPCAPALVHWLAAGTALGTGEHTQSWLQGCSLVPVSPSILLSGEPFWKLPPPHRSAWDAAKLGCSASASPKRHF